MRSAVVVALLAIAASPAAERVATGDGIVSATLQGKPVRVRIDPAAPAMPVFDQASADMAGMKPGMFGATFRVGAVKLSAHTGVATLAIDRGAPFKRRIAWAGARFNPHADGAIGPGGLPDKVVRFALAPSRPGERTLVLPMEGGGWGVRSARVLVGGTPVFVSFDPQMARSIATAAAGVAIAAANRGTVAGGIVPSPIGFGIERPTRMLTLADPLVIGPATIRQLAVRVSDGGPAGALPDADADPDEVIVLAKGKPGRAALKLGADALGRCSSLIFDEGRKEIRLTCA